MRAILAAKRGSDCLAVPLGAVFLSLLWSLIVAHWAVLFVFGRLDEAGSGRAVLGAVSVDGAMRR